jgi:predicted anti-sigma-YlaC factor YlaD
MNCKTIRDILLTDYIDGCCEPERLALVDGHLKICPECRQLLEMIQSRTVSPFVGAPVESVDPSVWQRIREKTEKRQVPDLAEIAGDFLMGIRKCFLVPAPALAWSLVVLLGVFSLLHVTTGPQVLVEQENKDQSVLVLAELIEGDNGATDYGTLIEQYFL